jgi:hypothetical protein
VKKLFKAPYLTNLLLAIIAVELWLLIRKLGQQDESAQTNPR